MPAERRVNSIESPAETCQRIVAHSNRIRLGLISDIDELQRGDRASHADGIPLLQQLLTSVNELIGAAANESAADQRGGGLERDEH